VPVRPAVNCALHLGSSGSPEFGKPFKGSEAEADDDVGGTALEDVGEQNTRAGDYWSDPGWREAGRQYHAPRTGRFSAADIQPERLAWLRHLSVSVISLDRSWREFNDVTGQPTFRVTLDAPRVELLARVRR
jgi:hypothetical protein